MIGKLLAPYEVYLWAALAVILLVGGILLVHHIEMVGVDRQQAADAKLVAAQVINKEEVEKRAQELTQAAAQQLHVALVAPAPVSPIVVRVCPTTPGSGHPVPANGGAVLGSVAPTSVLPGSVGDGSTAQGLDIAPSTEQLLQQADAEIAYWRSYHATCVALNICK